MRAQKPENLMWEIAKETGIPYYRGFMSEDKNSIPASYVIGRVISDTPARFGGGQTLVRRADVDFNVISQGNAMQRNSTHLRNVDALKNALKKRTIAFDIHEIGYDAAGDFTETTINFEVLYYGY